MMAAPMRDLERALENPFLGANTDAVLAESGFDATDRERLRAAGII